MRAFYTGIKTVEQYVYCSYSYVYMYTSIHTLYIGNTPSTVSKAHNFISYFT